MMGWKWWGNTRIEELQKKLNAPVLDTMLGFVAVPNHSMEDKWGLPVLRHVGKDWYDLATIREFGKTGNKGGMNYVDTKRNAS